jgi:serine/threonine protein kinase
VKLVRRERVSDPLTLALFEEEAAALARVSSPFVATVLGIGGRGSELPYLAMELIEGSTLATILRERGHLSLDEVRALVRDVADGLRAVHAAGIIHRDVKPHNVMLTATREGTRWKIVDFGVAQLHELAGAGSTVLAGTAPYMAPEHALGERVDARADLYALALVAYRALAGRPAFTGDDRVAIAEIARRDGPPDPRGGAPLTRELELVLRVGLAANAEDRFATAAELKSAFESAFEGKLADRLRRRAEALLVRQPWAPS